MCLHYWIYLMKFLNPVLKSCKEHFKGLISIFYIHLIFYQVIFIIFQMCVSIHLDTMLLNISWIYRCTRKRWCFHSLILLSRLLYSLASRRTEIYLSPHRNSVLKAVQKPWQTNKKLIWEMTEHNLFPVHLQGRLQDKWQWVKDQITFLIAQNK